MITPFPGERPAGTVRLARRRAIHASRGRTDRSAAAHRDDDP